MTDNCKGKGKSKFVPVFVTAAETSSGKGNDNNNDRNERVPSLQSDELDDIELDDDDNAHLDAIEAELLVEAEQRDPFFNALHSRRRAQQAQPTANIPANSFISRPTVSAPPRRGCTKYIKQNPYDRWPYYVLFSGECAGIYDSW